MSTVSEVLKQCKGDAVSIYQRVSIEHDIPLDLAKAMLISAVGIMPELKAAITTGNDIRSTRLASALVGPYLALSELLGVSRERIERAMGMTCEEYLKTTGAAIGKLAGLLAHAHKGAKPQ